MKSTLYLTVLLLLASTAHSQCGGEDRWDVKALKDGFIPPAAKPSTIAKLITLKAPVGWHKNLERQPLEKQCVTIECKITEVGVEADSDFHLVLSDGKHTMIGEIPRPECANPKYASDFQAARDWVVRKSAHYPKAIRPLKTPIPCRITGMVFFDMPDHDGTGHAPNEVEIHCILNIE